MMSQYEIITRYMVVLGKMLKKYPDGWYSTAFQSQIEKVISATYNDWKDNNGTDKEFWNAFVLSDLMFHEFAPSHFPREWWNKDFPNGVRVNGKG